MGVVANHNSGYDSKFHFFPGIDMKYRVWNTPKAQSDVFLSYNTAFRMPTFTDLFYKSPTNEGNKDLKPERVQSLRIGYRYNRSMFNVQCSMFRRILRYSSGEASSRRASFTTLSVIRPASMVPA